MHPEQCREWRGALGAAALDRLDPSEQLALQAHLDGCPSCRAELRELETLAGLLAYADLQHVLDEDRDPPAELGRQVLARVASARTRSHRRMRARVLAVAAAVALVVATGAIIAFAGADETRATHVALAGTDAHARVDLRAIDAGTEMHFSATGLDDGDWYWLWITGEDGVRVSAGTFLGTSDGVDLTMTAALPLSKAHRVWVTDDADSVVLDAQF